MAAWTVAKLVDWMAVTLAVSWAVQMDGCEVGN